MRPLIVTMALLSSVAAADQAVPTIRSGGWSGQCVERMEHAREALIAKDARYRAAVVEARADEQGEPSDPTSHKTVDVVTLSNKSPSVDVIVGADGRRVLLPTGEPILRAAVDDCLRMLKKRK